MLFALGFLFLFVIGGFTGLVLGIVPIDVSVHDTYYVVAHFHYVMVAGTLFAFFGGTYCWLPKWTGHMYDETITDWHFWLSFIFFNIAFFPMHFLGLAGMPRRVPDYAQQFTDWNMVSTIGAFGFGLSQLIFLTAVVKCIRGGAPAPAKAVGRGYVARVDAPFAGAVSLVRHAAGRQIGSRSSDIDAIPQSTPAAMATESTRRDSERLKTANRRTGLVLLAIVLVFFVGIILSRFIESPAVSIGVVGGPCCFISSSRSDDTCANEQKPGRAFPQQPRRSVIKLAVIVVAMFGFGFLVPFYEKICEVTGLRRLVSNSTCTERVMSTCVFATVSAASGNT